MDAAREPPAGSHAASAEPFDVPRNPARLRWAVNVERWRPAGDDEGAEFAFLLRLLPSHEREDVLKMRLVMDKKRALVSRLLQRAACARVAGIAWPDVVIARTRGRKPFLANAIALPHAPNFNFNVSHEGDFVVLASEPVAMCGVDVAAPGQARRPRADGRVPTADEMLATFGAVLTERERSVIRGAARGGGGDDDDAVEEAFQKHWSAKEALVKAMGVGLAFDLNRAEFEFDAPTTPANEDEDEDEDEREGAAEGDGRSAAAAATEARVRIDGAPPSAEWRFVARPVGGPRAHWVTVSRGPTSAVTDADGAFSATWRRRAPETFTERGWAEVLAAPEPRFDLVWLDDLVPETERDAYDRVAAGGPYEWDLSSVL